MKIYGAQLTGSIASTGNPVVTGSLTVSGNLTAQQFIVSSSVTFLTTSFSSGSTRFGDSSDDNHNFTGSVLMTGSLTVVTTGNEFQVNAGGVNIGNALTDNHVISGSVRINPNGLFVSSSGVVGIGTTSPDYVLVVQGDDSGGIGTIVSYDNAANAGGIGGGFSMGGFFTSTGVTPWAIIRAPKDNGNNGDFAGGMSFHTRTSSAFGERMRITSAGNVGIGTSSPTELLTLGKAGGGQVFQGKDNTTNYDIGYLQFNSDNMTLNPQGGVSGTTGYFRFITANTERMRILSGGGVIDKSYHTT